MTKIVLVGVDGSESSRRAARRAAQLATEMGATLHVMMAAERSGITRHAAGEAAEATAREVAAELTGLVAQVASSPLAGKPALALVEEAERLGASVIVVGNRGAQGVGRVLGNVASAVVAHAPCDVLVVKTV